MLYILSHKVQPIDINMKYRNLANVIKGRFQEKDPLIQVIIGPRQVGKTTALKQAIANNGVYETADYPTPLPYTIIEKWWKKASAHPSKILAIDEIQKITGWTEIIKKLWDTSNIKIKLVVTGSSSLLVEKGLKESLAGRFEIIRAEHWSFGEAQEIFNLGLKEFIEFGCYPGSISLLQKDIERWGQYVRDSIVEPALGRDLLQLHPVDQPALLRQVFGVAVSIPTQIISLQKLQGQLQGKGTLPTIQNYLRLLADAHLVTGLDKYSKQPIRTKKSSPKLIVHDNGLIKAFERPLKKSLSSERFGRYFENAVGARLLETGWNIFYWKERNLEVDFVALGPNGENYAIEVKSTEAEKSDFEGLYKFCEINSEFEPCLISFVEQQVSGIKTISTSDILSYSRKY